MLTIQWGEHTARITGERGSKLTEIQARAEQVRAILAADPFQHVGRLPPPQAK